jgi:uncharacterized SAM-binding protein YcdF (DUF218 family)
LSEREGVRIYPGPTHRATEKLHGAVAGFVTGAAAWLLLWQIGVPHIFGIGAEGGLLPMSLLGAVIGLTRVYRVIVYLTALVLLITFVVAYTNVIVGPARSFIRSDQVTGPADAVVALSAGVSSDGFLGQQGVDRLLSAMSLVKSGVAPVLVVTNEERRIGRSVVSTEDDQRRIISLAGVPAIITLGAVKSTHDEAVRISQMARHRGWHHIVLVTSPFHTRRACRTFERTGLTVTCVPSVSRDIAVRKLEFAQDRVAAFAMWLYETAGTLRYRQKGWI